MPEHNHNTNDDRAHAEHGRHDPFGNFDEPLIAPDYSAIYVPPNPCRVCDTFGGDATTGGMCCRCRFPVAHYTPNERGQRNELRWRERNAQFEIDCLRDRVWCFCLMDEFGNVPKC